MTSVQHYGESEQDDPGARRGRGTSFALAVTLGLCAVGMLAVGVRTTEPYPLAIYALCVTALVAFGAFVARRAPNLRAAMQREDLALRSVALAGALAMPFIVGDPYQLHVLTTAGIFAIMAIGLNVTIGYAGLADFGYVAYYAIGAYASALLNVDFGLSFWICLPAAGLVAALFSLVVAFPALRVKGHYLALVTLGFSFIVFQLIINLKPLTGGTEGVSGIDMPMLLGHDFGRRLVIGSVSLPREANYYYLVVAVLTLAAIAVTRLRQSRWGRVWAAMRLDDTAVEAAGINLTSLKLAAFMTGSSLGGIAGSLYAHRMGFIDPTSFHVIDSIMLLAVVALGNWKTAGVIAAAIVFSILPEKLRAFQEFRPLIFAVALLCVMLLRGRRMASLLGR